MARTALAVQTPTTAGLNPVYSAANVDGHSIANDGATILIAKNAGASPCVITEVAPGKFAGLELTDPTVTVPITTGERILGPWNPAAFNQPDGTVHINFDQVTSVTVAAIKVKMA